MQTHLKLFRVPLHTYSKRNILIERYIYRIKKKERDKRRKEIGSFTVKSLNLFYPQFYPNYQPKLQTKLKVKEGKIYKKK